MRRLVKLVECQYARDSFPQVFDSLMRIHRAQEQSIHLLRKGVVGGDVDVLRLCFEKGGASVLADGYLAAGSLTHEQAALSSTGRAFCNSPTTCRRRGRPPQWSAYLILQGSRARAAR